MTGMGPAFWASMGGAAVGATIGVYVVLAVFSWLGAGFFAPFAGIVLMAAVPLAGLAFATAGGLLVAAAWGVDP